MKIVIVLFMGMLFSNDIIANNKISDSGNKSDKVYYLISGYRYVGWCVDGAGFTLFIVTDGNYYYRTLCNPSYYTLKEEGCLPKKLYNDSKGWYELNDGEKYYLYYYYNGDRCIVRNIERDTMRD